MVKKIIPSIIRLQPDNFTHNVWGGHWIPQWKKILSSFKPVGESWEFSAHKNHPNSVTLSDGTKTNLRDLIRRDATSILGSTKKNVPFLLKFIDARENLSVQVHPSDAYAEKKEKDPGKAESWVILGTGPKTADGFIYLGFNKTLTRTFATKARLSQAFKEALNKKSVSLILPFLNKIPVKPGEIYDVRPGTIHAIGQGVRLFEIQQTSDLTYRIWDWNRFPERPFHLAKAFDVLRFHPQNPAAFRAKIKRIKAEGRGIFREEKLLTNRKGGFVLHKLTLQREKSSIEQKNRKGFSVLTVIEGEIEVLAKNGFTQTQDKQSIQSGHSVMIPSFVKQYELSSVTNRAIVLKSTTLR